MSCWNHGGSDSACLACWQEAQAEAIAEVVALIMSEGEGEARACDHHAQACTGNKTRVPVKRMHQCAAGQTRATVERILDAITRGDYRKGGA